MLCRGIVSLVAGLASIGVVRAFAQVEYTVDGAPTAGEEQIRWLLNRGRYDSASENVERGTSYTDIPTNGWPLAPHHSLTAAARNHSGDMASLNELQHDTLPGSEYYNVSDDSKPDDRMEVEGYSPIGAWGENISAGTSRTHEDAYLSWWNVSGHRQNMYASDPEFNVTEIGCGYGYNPDTILKNFYTMDLGRRSREHLFTGTLFSDVNTNGQYDPGEGVPGVTVLMESGGDPTEYYDVSAAAGSFAIPFDDVAQHAEVIVSLSNSTASAVSLSIPTDYHNFETVSLQPGQSRPYGVFERTTTTLIFISPPEMVGWRNLKVFHVPMVAACSAAESGVAISWHSRPGNEYRVCWSTDMKNWTPATSSFSGGSGDLITHTDIAAFARGSSVFYRVESRPAE